MRLQQLLLRAALLAQAPARVLVAAAQALAVAVTAAVRALRAPRASLTPR